MPELEGYLEKGDIDCFLGIIISDISSIGTVSLRCYDWGRDCSNSEDSILKLSTDIADLYIKGMGDPSLWTFLLVSIILL